MSLGDGSTRIPFGTSILTVAFWPPELVKANLPLADVPVKTSPRSRVEGSRLTEAGADCTVIGSESLNWPQENVTESLNVNVGSALRVTGISVDAFGSIVIEVGASKKAGHSKVSVRGLSVTLVKVAKA